MDFKVGRVSWSVQVGPESSYEALRELPPASDEERSKRNWNQQGD